MTEGKSVGWNEISRGEKFFNRAVTDRKYPRNNGYIKWFDYWPRGKRRSIIPVDLPRRHAIFMGIQALPGIPECWRQWHAIDCSDHQAF